ncbi:MAG TPA: PAS domain S-box protein [Vicinamibacterales bacterium]|jgi:PAS domain S-box-containing protein
MPDARIPDAALRLAAIVESSDDAIVSKDLKGYITSWNRSAERMFGYSAEEAVGKHITLIIPKDRYAEEDGVLARICRGEAVEHFETIRERKDGSTLPVSLTVSPIRDPSGTVIGASKIARDITDRTRAEALLAEAETAQADLQRRLLTLVEASGTLMATPRLDAVLDGAMALARELVAADAYAIWRQDTYAREWCTEASLGLSDELKADILATFPDDLEELPFTEPLAIDDADSAPLLERRRQAYERSGIRGVLIVPLTIRGRRSGTFVFYSKHRHAFDVVEVQTARAIGNLAAAAMTTAELYEEQRKSREQADFLVQVGATLAGSLDYTETLTLLAHLAVPKIADWCAIDLVEDDGTLRRLALAQVDEEKVRLAATVQERYYDPASPFTADSVVKTGRSVILPHVSDAMLSASARGDGERLRLVRALGLVSYMCVPITAHTRVVGAMSFVSAESRRHFTDQDLRFVEQVASRAGLAIENARAYVEARDANRLKDEFLATLSHELRTPLNTLLGYARMLSEGVIPAAKQRRAVEIIERNATSLSQIVADVLDVSRIISGKLRLELQPADLPSIIREALETVRPAADAKTLRIVIALESLDSIVQADAQRLQQVIWNLMSNAVKFTPQGGRIDVRLRQDDADVVIEVADSGIGIAADFLPYVFDRFRQADSRFSREHGGLGLGLAIARHIIEMHGGQIDVASEGSGKGSTFCVRLPTAAIASDATTLSPSEKMPTRRLAGVRVLAVDDQEDALAMLRDALEAAGADVTTAVGAEEAIRLIELAPPDVLVSDLGMPGMDGFELIRRVRKSANLRAQRLPAAAITAYARPEDRALALESGFQVHMPKPVDPNEVVRVVGSLAHRD